MDPSYTSWVFHGESYTPQFQEEGRSGGVQVDDDKTREEYHLYRNVFVSEEEVGHTISEAKDYEFADLLEDAETPLFPGCTTYTKLPAVVTLYNYKSTNGHTDNSFNELLKILGGMLPEKNTLPETVYLMRKMLKPFDLEYEKIHACPNDCCLFRKEFKDLDSCPKCGSSRWKVDKITSKVHKGVPEKENLMLTLLIPGPKQPGNDIDVYLEPLVEDLKELWDTGVEAYDAFSKSMFNLKAILMWTINDFPAYGNLAGCTTKGKVGCPICGEDICSMWLKYSRKFAYMGHRRFLAADHPFLKDIENDWGKKQKGQTINTFQKKRKTPDNSKRGLLLRHNLDVMHVEKNVCENIIGTLLNVKKKIQRWLKKIKLPDGYSSNIGNCVSLEDRKLIGLKSHDCHVLMQQLLSVALRNLLLKGPRNALFLLCAFYNELCQRVLDRNCLEQLEENIVQTLCMLERFMKILKGYVKNRARPEGCIAECYLAEERMRFGSAYIKKAASIGVRSNRNADLETGLFEGRPISQGKVKILEDHVLQAAYRYVLFNTAEVEPYLQMHIEELKQVDHRFIRNEGLLQKQHMETFAQWLSKHVPITSSGRIQWLAHGPRKHVISYTGYIINGYRFHTIDVGRSTQDSGVSIESDTVCQSSGNDYSYTIGRLSYYEVIRDIIVLDYYSFKVPVFRCDWANHGIGIKIEDGFTLINLHQGLSTFESDPFILASQAKQVFYFRDDDESNWYVLLKAPPRGIHDMNLIEEDAYTSSTPLDVSRLEINITENEPYVRNECEGIDVTDP
ncbi:uncharacterized protein LOC121980216 [Zingiber officinale]|uniref:uncharacterized protein LOC121980216 n=1 Tax=Zingiber officinale TaxID=94328 RepID=UPI001C4C7BFD|nr:uncharacterized protein LOC121980216 [Zingiber officinale]